MTLDGGVHQTGTFVEFFWSTRWASASSSGPARSLKKGSFQKPVFSCSMMFSYVSCTALLQVAWRAEPCFFSYAGCFGQNKNMGRAADVPRHPPNIVMFFWIPTALQVYSDKPRTQTIPPPKISIGRLETAPGLLLPDNPSVSVVSAGQPVEAGADAKELLRVAQGDLSRGTPRNTGADRQIYVDGFSGFGSNTKP